MEETSVLKRIDKDREKVEGCFVFCLWSDPDLYADYIGLNEGTDETLKNNDAKFYYIFGRELYKSGYRNFDHITIDTYLSGKKESLRKRFEEYGGYQTVAELKAKVNANNVEGYFDQIVKMNTLAKLYKSYKEAFDNVEKFDSYSAEDVYNRFEYINNDISISAGNNERIEDLTIDDEFVAHLDRGEEVGFSYAKYATRLNYITLGAAPSSLYLIGAFSGSGKTSFVFEVMLMGMHESGTNVAIISNEMLIETYKMLLIEHVLMRDLDYWGLTRKKLKQGRFTDEQKEVLSKAQKIIKEKYSNIKFVKMFDNNINKILKYMRKLRSQGTQVVFYDTFKSDDDATDGNLWQSLMLDARKLFQCCSKLGICCITTYQLALHTENQRYLSAGCLSNSKQIKEVYETMVYMRPVWQDEYPGERYDIHPYRLNKDNPKIKEEIALDPEKKYMLFFVDKTRADEDKQIVLFEWNPRFNKWTELGYAKVVNDHRLGVT